MKTVKESIFCMYGNFQGTLSFWKARHLKNFTVYFLPIIKLNTLCFLDHYPFSKMNISRLNVKQNLQCLHPLCIW